MTALLCALGGLISYRAVFGRWPFRKLNQIEGAVREVFEQPDFGVAPPMLPPMGEPWKYYCELHDDWSGGSGATDPFCVHCQAGIPPKYTKGRK